LGAGVVPALALHSELGSLEEARTARLVHLQRCYLLLLSCVCAALFLALAALSLQPADVAVMARSLAAWLGLALLSGRVLGWRLAWVLPVLTLCVLVYWGGSAAQVDPFDWWEFSARPAGDVPSLVVSAALLASGMLAYFFSAWRITALKRRATGRHH